MFCGWRNGHVDCGFVQSQRDAHAFADRRVDFESLSEKHNGRVRVDGDQRDPRVGVVVRVERDQLRARVRGQDWQLQARARANPNRFAEVANPVLPLGEVATVTAQDHAQI